LPITSSAKKALRKDKRKTVINKTIRKKYRSALKKARKNPTKKNLDLAYSMLDRAAKKNIIHKKKASRLKSRIAKKKKT
jgi:small subunit ribosomal protein S20